MLVSVLCIVDRKTHDAANLAWERSPVVSGRPDPYGGLWFYHSASSYSNTAIESSTDLTTKPTRNGCKSLFSQIRSSLVLRPFRPRMSATTYEQTVSIVETAQSSDLPVQS